MRAPVQVTLRGGPGGDQTFEMPLPLCEDEITVEGATWGRREPDGDVTLVKGPRPPRGRWLFYTLDTYRKVAPVRAGRAEYRFTRTRTIERCQSLTKAGVPCANSAREGQATCPTHGRMSRRAASDSS